MIQSSNSAVSAKSGVDDALLKRKRASLATDVLRLATGTGASQLIGILAAPLIARMFAPSAFGTLAIFAAVSSLISVASTLRYEQAIYLPEDEADAANIAALCFNLVIATSLMSTVGIWAFGDYLQRWGRAEQIGNFIWLLPLNVAVTGTFTILNSWNTRDRRFGRITVMQVISRVGMTGAQIVAGLAGFVTGGTLIVTTIFGAFLTAVILGFLTLRDKHELFLHKVGWEKMRQVSRRYSTFPRFGLAANVLNNASWQLPPILLGSFFNVDVAGRYSFGFRVLRVPGNLIGASFGRAFFPRAAEANQIGTLAESVQSALRYLVLLSFFPCFLLSLVGDKLFIVAFGQRWAEAGVYAQILSVWLFFWFISTPLNTVFTVLEEQALELRFQTANIVSRFLALTAGGLAGSARTAIALFAICGVVVYGSYCLAVLKKAGASPRSTARVMLACLLKFIPVAALIVGLRSFSVAPIIIVVTTAIILIGYYAQLAHTDPGSRKALMSFLGKWRPSKASGDGL